MVPATSPRLRQPVAPAPAERFECWSQEHAAKLASRFDRMTAGFLAGVSGAPCPGATQDDSYRLGWEFGAVEAKRVPMPDWLAALGGRTAFGGTSPAPPVGTRNRPANALHPA